MFIMHSRTARPIAVFARDGAPGPSMQMPVLSPASCLAGPFTMIIGAAGPVEIAFSRRSMPGSARHSSAAITIGRCAG